MLDALAPRRLYVVGKDMAARVVHVARGGSHPALFTEAALLAAPMWVAGHPPAGLSQVALPLPSLQMQGTW